MNADEFSDSGGSSSTGSKTTKYTISQEVIQLGENPVVPTTFKQFMLFFPSQLFQALTFMFEFIYIGDYCGLANSSLYAFIYPFSEILLKKIPAALAASCANSAYKNITAGQYAAANVYFAYYFLAGAIYACLVLVFGLTVMRPNYATEDSRLYFICYFCVFPVLEIFTGAVQKFYEVENRIGISFCQQLFSLLLIVGFNPFVLNTLSTNQATDVLGLDSIIYARCIDYAIQFFWNVVIIARIKVMEVEYFGVLKFSSKRLRPFRIRLLLQIYVNSLSDIIIESVFPLCVLVVTLIYKYMRTTDYQLDLLYLKNCLVIITESVIMSIHHAFNDSFYLIASYNIGVKKLARVAEFLKWHLVFDLAISVPVCIVFFFTAKIITSKVIPVVKSPTRYRPYEVDECTISIQITALALMFGFLMLLNNSLLSIEEEARLSCILQLPVILYVLVSPFLSIAIVGETTPLSLIVGLVEFVNGIIALPMIIYFNWRYKNLAKAEQLKQQQIEEQTRKAGEVDEIRLTVSQAFDKDVEEEDERTAKLKTQMQTQVRLSMTGREKIDRLSNSMAFESLARQFGSQTNRFNESVLRRSTFTTEDSVDKFEKSNPTFDK